jgi:tetratricopeptide (TPR) repeat protein
MPTVLDYLGIPPPPDLDGESLRPIIEAGQEPEEDRYAFMQSTYTLLHYAWSPLTAMVSFRYKYIEAPRPEFYDLAKDPRELNDLLEGGTGELPGEAVSALALLKTQLERKQREWSAKKIASQDADITAQMRQQLQALGYVAGGFKGNLDLAQKKDPKDYVDLLPRLMEQRQAHIDEDFAKVMEISKEVLERDPENPEALSQRASVLFSVGRFQEAIETYRFLFDTHSPTFDGLMDVGHIYIAMAQQDPPPDPETREMFYNQAIEYFKQAIELRKNRPSPQPHYYLAQIYMLMGNLDEAYKELTSEALADTELGMIGMAMLYEREGRLALAESEFKKAGELSAGKEKNVIYWVEWGRFLIRHGRPEEAVELFEKAMAEDSMLKNTPMFMRDYDYAKEAKAKKDGRPFK